MLPDDQWNAVGSLDEAGWVVHVAAGGGYVYIDEVVEGEAVLDIRDPARPRRIGSLPQFSSILTVVNDRAYGGGARLKIFDLSDPEAPALLGSINPPVSVSWIDVRDPFVFVAGGGDSPEQDAAIIDTSDPTTPQVVSLIDTLDEVESAGLNGETWFLSTASGLHVFDVVNPAAPQSLGVFPDIRFVDIAFSGDIAFMVGDTIQTVDVSDPSNPTVLHTWPTGFRRFDRIALAGAYLFAGTRIPFGEGTLFLVTNPVDPQTLIQYGELNAPWTVADNLLMVADDQRGMAILRIGDQADLNLDARVNLQDLATLLGHFGASGSARRPDGDLDGDADVDGEDLLQLLEQFGGGCE
jgi:hypothetical protein